METAPRRGGSRKHRPSIGQLILLFKFVRRLACQFDSRRTTCLSSKALQVLQGCGTPPLFSIIDESGSELGKGLGMFRISFMNGIDGQAV